MKNGLNDVDSHNDVPFAVIISQQSTPAISQPASTDCTVLSANYIQLGIGLFLLLA